jgi:hypothetical protein
MCVPYTGDSLVKYEAGSLARFDLLSYCSPSVDTIHRTNGRVESESNRALLVSLDTHYVQEQPNHIRSGNFRES